MTTRYNNIPIICADCSKRFTVLRELAGHIAVCPGCGARIEVPEGPEPVEASSGAETVTLLRDQLQERRQCPVCQAQIQAADRVCVACGYDLTEGRHIQTTLKKSPERGGLARRVLNAAAIAALAYAVYKLLLRFL